MKRIEEGVAAQLLNVKLCSWLDKPKPKTTYLGGSNKESYSGLNCKRVEETPGVRKITQITQILANTTMKRMTLLLTTMMNLLVIAVRRPMK